MNTLRLACPDAASASSCGVTGAGLPMIGCRMTSAIASARIWSAACAIASAIWSPRTPTKLEIVVIPPASAAAEPLV